MKTTVYKMGEKLGLYFSKEFINKNKFIKGDLISVDITNKNNKSETFLAKFNYNITLRTETIKNLGIIAGEIVELEIKKLSSNNASSELFYNGKIDLLYLINKIDSSKKFIIFPFKKKNQDFLKIWCCHNRGSCREVELKRFLEIDHFGRLLGLLQAEGSKGFRFKLEFVNKDLQEHLDYIGYLEEVGISKNQIRAGLVTHPDLISSIDVSNFKSLTGIEISEISKSYKSRGGYGFRLVIRSSIIAEIILGSMDYLRNLLANSKWDKDLENLARGFFAKLLNGDGSIELLTKNRKTPEARVKVVDQNLSYLEDYKQIMIKFGFNPKIDKKYIYVRSYANLENLLTLYRIKAFYKTDKWKKLIDVIKAKLSLAKNSSLKLTSLNEHYSDVLSDFSKHD